MTAEIAIGGAGLGGSPYSSYTTIPHMLGSANRSFVVNDNQLSVFDFTLVPLPASLPPTCPGGIFTACDRSNFLEQPPVNNGNSWRCAAGGVDVLSNAFMKYR